MQNEYAEFIRRTIRSVPDWPQPGVTFRDITPVLQDPRAFRVLIDLFVYRYMRQRLDLVAGVDARGFIVGSVLAYELNLGFVPVRKKGKLPYRTVAEEYSLEYGNAAVEMHTDAVRTGQRVLLVDDLIATGGTMLAAIKLLQRLGANVVEAPPSSTCPTWAAPPRSPPPAPAVHGLSVPERHHRLTRGASGA